MANKDPKTILEQVELLSERQMLFRDIEIAPHFLSNISYYRLKGYWWEMQSDKVNHIFQPDSYFEDVIDIYNFDRHLRLIVFNAIERIEIALRTKMIYHLSLSHGSTWYLNSDLFPNKRYHEEFIRKINKNLSDSSEEFILKHKSNHPDDSAEAWKALEIITLGSLSSFIGI